MNDPRELPDGRRLFRLDYIVEVGQDHPMHDRSKSAEFLRGKLVIWCFDEEIHHAAARAHHFFNVLPFRTISDVIEWDQNIAPDNEAYHLIADMAERVGYAAHFEPAEAAALPNERGITPKAA